MTGPLIRYTSRRSRVTYEFTEMRRPTVSSFIITPLMILSLTSCTSIAQDAETSLAEVSALPSTNTAIPRSTFTPTLLSPTQTLSVEASTTAVTSELHPPSFDIPPTPPDGSQFTVAANDVLVIDIQASDPDPDDIVTLKMIGGGAQLMPNAGNPARGRILLAPGSSDVGIRTLQLVATDSTNLSSEPLMITIEILAGPEDTPIPLPLIPIIRLIHGAQSVEGRLLTFCRTIPDWGKDCADGLPFVPEQSLIISSGNSIEIQIEADEPPGQLSFSLGDAVASGGEQHDSAILDPVLIQTFRIDQPPGDYLLSISAFWPGEYEFTGTYLFRVQLK